MMKTASRFLGHGRDVFAIFVYAGILILGAFLPRWLTTEYYLRVIVYAMVNSVIALGLNFAVGVAGQINLGQAVFVGLGAYVLAILTQKLKAPWIPSVGAALLTTALLGTALGWMSNRLRGPYLAVTTLATNLIFYLVASHEVWLTGGPMGIRIPWANVPKVFGAALEIRNVYYIVWGSLAILLFLGKLIYQSKIGRSFRAVRDDETVAALMGVNVVQTKMWACTICALYGGIGGALYVLTFRFVAPSEFTALQSFRYLAMITIGGLGNLNGSVLGSFAVTLVPEFLRFVQGYWDIILGVSIIGVLLLFPKGLGFIGEYLSRLLAPKKVEVRWTGEFQFPEAK
ncbi:MAG: branched-chain amino acid ABC transporter permease [Candidatus Bathyarchaeia archaeon]